MKTIVVYKTTSGFTKKYAEWISEELQADLMERSEVNIKILTKYDTIIYGGSLHVVGISGANIIKKNYGELKDKKIIIFTTGASLPKEKVWQEIKKYNFIEEELENIKFYYFRGGFDFNKLNIFYKIVMTLLKWKIKSSKNKTPDEVGMLEAYEKPMDFTKKENITDLINYVKKLTLT